jgi:mRNA-degrading endonuclease YafQ of YafQ-DinJ toxin-antitoxin module
MEQPLPQSYASHPVSGPWSPYQDHVVDYAAGDSYLTAQVNGEQGNSYQDQVCAAISP